MSKKCFYVIGALFITLAACGRGEEPATTTTEPAPAAAPAPAGVTAGTITLGKAVGPDKKITTPAETFAKNDTLYASVDTTGTGTATLKARWTYRKGTESTVVEEQMETIMPTGPATTEFHISKSDGWPAGDYQVEIFLDDRAIGTRSFTVK
jgi:hypothetical protein